MGAYCVAKSDIHDQTTYAKYSEGFLKIVHRHKGRLLSVDESPMVLVDDWLGTRTVILEFEHKESALTWYHSAEYEAFAKLRFDASYTDEIVINGINLSD